jgi:hypothetical protein
MRMVFVFIIGIIVGTYLSDYVVALGQSIAYAVGRVPGG